MQQISTFAVNYQGRPFREAMSDNKAMFYGIVGVAGLAFACSMELIPEMNESMKLVPFSDEFKTTMTGTMALDFAGCWAIEVVLKRFFSDFRPKDIALRRPEQVQREREREVAAEARREQAKEMLRLQKVAEFERKVEERKRAIEAWRTGRQ